eukprot:2637797-Pyramimonas_sp.AAC.1
MLLAAHKPCASRPSPSAKQYRMHFASKSGACAGAPRPLGGRPATTLQWFLEGMAGMPAYCLMRA